MTIKKKERQLDRAKFWIDNGILFCEIRNPDKTRVLEVETVQYYIEVIANLCKGKPMPFLIDLRFSGGAFLSPAAKLLASSPELEKLRLSEAYVANSLKMRLLISSYKRIYEPITPFKICNDFEEGLAYSINAKKTLYGSH